MNTLYFFLLVVLSNGVLSENTPIVLWHGMGDSCCFSFSLGAFQKKLNESLGGVYIYSIQIGNNIIEDVENSFFKYPLDQLNETCETLSADPALVNGFNAIGFSQGGQFLRGLVQRCPTIKMKNLITLGAQHQGVYGLPRCGALPFEICNSLRKILSQFAYNRYVQDILVQATYWHDPINEETYKHESAYLGEINNERNINQDYIERLQSLENLVMVKFINDTMVQPVESEWFGFYKPGQAIETETLQESSLYTDDRLGLKKMDEESKLHFLEVEGDHLRFPWTWFEENIIEKFLK
ncbi:palmitoyl-protein thioesterase 1 [Diorhabda carinulata]|uniref:palmitoyl-protein thioesterase 1 n=1 Tax=Diorhabda carinulata TaxID=1163345 RepID=UPI0025A20E51|nr:palmitoyl-protein thioesterase 1 [Diorhabda carinulata]